MLHAVQALRCCVVLNERKRKNVYYLYYAVWQLLVLVELILGFLFWSFDFFKRLELNYVPVHIEIEWQKWKFFTDLCPSFGNDLGCVLVHWFSSTQSLWVNYCHGTSITALPNESNLVNLGLFLISISIFSGRTDYCGSQMPQTKYFNQVQCKLWKNVAQRPHFLLCIHAVCQIAVDQLFLTLLFEVVSMLSRLNWDHLFWFTNCLMPDQLLLLMDSFLKLIKLHFFIVFL